MNPTYAGITLLSTWAPKILQEENPSKEDLQEVLLLCQNLEEMVPQMNGLYPLYLMAKQRVSPHRSSLLSLTLEEAEKIIPPEKRSPLSWWGIHFSDFYKEGILPWSKASGKSPRELFQVFSQKLPLSELVHPDGSWNSNLTGEEILLLLR